MKFHKFNTSSIAKPSQHPLYNKHVCLYQLREFSDECGTGVRTTRMGIQGSLKKLRKRPYPVTQIAVRQGIPLATRYSIFCNAFLARVRPYMFMHSRRTLTMEALLPCKQLPCDYMEYML